VWSTFGPVGLTFLCTFLIQTEISNTGNGGNGGKATSGSAFAHGPGAKAYSGPGGNAAGGDVGRREPTHSLTSKKMPYPRLSPREEYVSARHSTGKFTPSKSGGDHYGGLVDVGSGNVSPSFSLPPSVH
jgi:hypothetical protein